MVLGVLIFSAFKLRAIEFDDTNMYLSHGKNEEAIPLKSIYKINMTSVRINNISMWKIEYRGTESEEEVIRFFPRIFYKEFNAFCNNVQRANKHVDIVNWASNF